jgi:hypothetical protein
MTVQTTELITFDRVLRLLPYQCHWIEDFKRFILVYYMWSFQWIFTLQYSMKFEAWKPSRQHFKSSKLQGKIFRRDIL